MLHCSAIELRTNIPPDLRVRRKVRRVRHPSGYPRLMTAAKSLGPVTPETFYLESYREERFHIKQGKVQIRQ